MMQGRSLAKKMALVLVFVALSSTLLTALSGVYAARQLFARYLNENSSMQAKNWADAFSAYYQKNGSFSGIENQVEPLPRGKGYGRMLGGGGNSRVMLVGLDNTVVFDSAGQLTGQSVDRDQVATGAPVKVDAKTVGIVITSRPGMGGLGSLESEFVDSLTLYSLLIGLAAGILALLMGVILIRPISQMIYRLSQATHRIAQGELDISVPVEGGGELRQLAEDFNTMAESLKKTETMRRNLTADIAHELRTPLTILRANLESLQSGATTSASETIASLHDEVIRMGKLIKDMETLALAESGHLTLHRKKTGFEVVLERLAPVFMDIEARHFVLKKRLDQRLPEVDIDEDRILQVMLNLISNAISHSPPGGEITIQAEKEIGFLRISVIDQGMGISEEQLPFVFERFFRADNARSRKEGGMGLGLAIARTFVEAHGGKIWAESQIGQGSTFTFTCPFAKV
ncbi:MAG TPA: ATP-binding protein [Syntrophomonadaceae bacterium]|nr:ATP-binding protein [Syntrophomonadaceae bacterium]